MKIIKMMRVFLLLLLTALSATAEEEEYVYTTSSPTSSPSRSPVRSYDDDSHYYQYTTSKQEESDGRIHRRHSATKKTKDFYTHISDVLFCLAMALGWTVWMLSSFVKSDVTKYQNDSVVVRGHVLQVSVEGDALLGVPTYKAVIDYMVVPTTEEETSSSSRPVDSSAIQIRKQFETQQQLQEGFANVELLVLPNEPTYSVIKEDWEKEVEELDDLECWRTAWFRRMTIAFAGTLVMASVAGGIHVVTLLDPTRRMWGWILVCVGIPCLLPAAILIHWLLQSFQRFLDMQAERISVVRGAERVSPFQQCEDMMDARACDEHPFTFNSIKATKSATNVPETAGCYFIRFPTKRLKKHQHAEPEESSVAASLKEHESVSTVSSISIQERSGSGWSRFSAGSG